MRRLTALLHTFNDGLRVGRCLETLYPCDNIVIVDNGSTDQTLRVAREYGANILPGRSGLFSEQHSGAADSEWLLSLDACEALTEGLAATLFEWKSLRTNSGELEIFSVFLREETPNGWVEHAEAQTRVVPRNWQSWKGNLPVAEQASIPLTGELLRFSFP